MKNQNLKYKIRKSIQQALDAIQENQFWRNAVQSGIVAASIFGTAFMFPSSQSIQFSGFKDGDVYTGKEIIAPFTFYINKSEEEVANDRKAAAEKIPLVFIKVDSVEKSSLAALANLFDGLKEIQELAVPDTIKLKRLRDLLDARSIIIDGNNLPYLISQPILPVETRGRKKNARERLVKTATDLFQQTLRRIIIDIHAIGLLDRNGSDIPPYVAKISVVSSEGEILENLERFYTRDKSNEVVLEKLRQKLPDNEVAVKVGYPIITACLRPNLFLDQATTDKRINNAVATVALSKGLVLENERILDRHEVITPQILEKLNSLAAAKAERETNEGGAKLILPYVGQILLIALAFSFSLMFLSVSRPNVFTSLKRMSMIFFIFMLVVTATFLITRYGFSTNLRYLIPISIASMLLTIFFDNRTAFMGTVSLSIIIGAMYGNDFGLLFISLFVGTISTFSVREIQARNWILKGILYISGAYILSTGAVELYKHTDFDQIWNIWTYGLINGLLSPILAYGLMIIFEFIFQMTTNSTLLELSDLNKSLLRDLAIRAPGTYHHSIMVGNLSEAAAEAIGANALLTRVGAYYHDIGKMEKPEYFVENQKAGKNPHEKLTPTMSCLILINHVKKGLDIAEEHNLPYEIRSFIPQHHGTNLIRYFYQKAIESSSENEVDEANFRYPGPPPRTKEAGIIMLADAVEAGSRVLKDPSVSRIRSMIDSLIHERLLESEFDECPLTIRDLKAIRESFVKTLAGMFHGRIEYPKSEDKAAKKTNKRSAETRV